MLDQKQIDKMTEAELEASYKEQLTQVKALDHSNGMIYERLRKSCKFCRNSHYPICDASTEVFHQVNLILKHALTLNSLEVKPESRLIEDLKMDSLATVTISCDIEDALDIKIEYDDLEHVTTVQQLCDLIVTKLSERN